MPKATTVIILSEKHVREAPFQVLQENTSPHKEQTQNFGATRELGEYLGEVPKEEDIRHFGCLSP